VLVAVVVDGAVAVENEREIGKAPKVDFGKK
jgi:hypothetical protein